MDKIKFGKHVDLAYEIFTVDDGGEAASVFKFTDKHPDSFVYGLDKGMIDGFANAINGLAEGDSFDFTLEPKDAFGEKNPDMVQVLDKSIFCINGEFDTDRVYEGAVVPMQTADGFRIDGFVKEITPDKVTIDFNHQLAGERVRYAGKVLAVRDATPDEMSPKGASCNCGGSCGEGGCEGCSGGCH